jgi:hypothetical protein
MVPLYLLLGSRRQYGRKNGCFEMALAKAKHELSGLIRTIEKTDSVSLASSAWNQSFARVARFKKAVTDYVGVLERVNPSS